MVSVRPKFGQKCANTALSRVYGSINQQLDERAKLLAIGIEKGARPMAPPKPRRRPGFAVIPRPKPQRDDASRNGPERGNGNHKFVLVEIGQ